VTETPTHAALRPGPPRRRVPRPAKMLGAKESGFRAPR
jgi:hypothetical protein